MWLGNVQQCEGSDQKFGETFVGDARTNDAIAGEMVKLTQKVKSETVIEVKEKQIAVRVGK